MPLSSLSVADNIAINGMYEGYKVADQDQADDTTTYFGFQNGAGEWFILKQVVADTVTSYRYYRGAEGVAYSTGWTGRAGYSYGYFASVFPVA